MSVPYVCLRCRQRTSQILRSLKGRGFVSLNASSIKPDNSDSALLSTDAQKKERIAKANDGKNEAKISDGSTWGKPLESVNSMLERLFESTRRTRPNLPVKSRYSKTLNPTYVLVDDNPLTTLKHDLDTIQGMMDKEIPTRRTLNAMITLASFKNHSGRGARSDAEKSLLRQNSTLQDLLLKVIHERVSLLGSESKAKLVDLVQVYIVSDVMREQWWHMIFIHLLAEVTKSRTRLSENGSPTLDNSDTQFKRYLYLLSDVIQVWKIFAKAFGNPSDLSRIPDRDSSSNVATTRDDATLVQDWEGLPSPAAVSNINRGLRPRLSTQLLYCFPKKAEGPSTTALAGAAAMTYVSLCAAEKSSIVSDSLATESKPFMNFITQIICNTSSDEPAFFIRLSNGLKKRGIVQGVVDQLFAEWRGLRKEAMDRQRSNSGKGTKDTASEPSRQTTNALIERQEKSVPSGDSDPSMITEDISVILNPVGPKIPLTGNLTSNLLRRATKESDLKLALNLWKRQVELMGTREEFNDFVFVEFLRTFFAVARPDCATEVWNTMCKHGIKPTTLHWVTLLEGCKRIQDLASLKSIWRRMEAAGMQNTNQAWTVYISALLYCKDWRSALKAVEYLVKAWKLSNVNSASKSGEAGFTDKQQAVHKADRFAPSIFPINAAMSGLLGNYKPDIAQQILTWAISENIKPDTTTFNILLRPAVRRDNTKAVQQLLSEMKQHACDPDVVTFTILIDGIFRNPGSAFQVQTPEAQQAFIVRIFKDMQDNHITATPQTYSTILDGLLQPKYFNLSAARAVLARMADQGIRPTPHIYTILVTHYFSLAPPDLPAIDSLWRRIELEKSPVDHILYDRMIEGYGRVGALDKMLALLRRMPGEGKRPGWIALLGSLRALAQAEEWGLVADLVRDVADEKEGLLRFGSRGWKGEDEFWDFVEVLRERGLEMPGRGGIARNGEVGEEDGGEERIVNSDG
ncbi:hypothetical protein MMC34_000552 [Xylographa carneopallida]|nr:hypothetical protein [Xylographa carneopallida]